MAASTDQVAYVYRWNVTELGMDQSVATPWKLLWSKSPIWFEKLRPGGDSESPGRRIADNPEGFITVMKRTLYLLDKNNGKTLWSLPLEGEEISDWKINGNMFAYAATNWKLRSYIRAGIDVQKRKQVWFHSLVPKKMHQHEWVVSIPRQGWVYGLTYNDWGSEAPLDNYDLMSGNLLWSIPRGLEPMEDKSHTWFVYNNTLNVLVGAKEGGFYVQPYDLNMGKKLDMLHLYGEARSLSVLKF